MNESAVTELIVVGVDGSSAALDAAAWAAEEAAYRDARVHLVHVLAAPDCSSQGAPTAALESARSLLREAVQLVQTRSAAVPVSTGVLHGSPRAVLVDRSRDATLVCVGSAGIGWLSSRLSGSTVLTLAQSAYCPVAVIHCRQGSGTGRWIVVAVDDHSDSDHILELAFEEARIRRAPVLAVGVWRTDLGQTYYDELDHRLDRWQTRYPDVTVEECTTPTGIAPYLAGNGLSIQLLVIGGTDVPHLPRIIGPHGHAMVSHPRCSVLIVR